MCDKMWQRRVKIVQRTCYAPNLLCNTKRKLCSPCCRATWWPHPSGHARVFQSAKPSKVEKIDSQRRRRILVNLKKKRSKHHQMKQALCCSSWAVRYYHPPINHGVTESLLSLNVFIAFHYWNCVTKQMITSCHSKERRRYGPPQYFACK